MKVRFRRGSDLFAFFLTQDLKKDNNLMHPYFCSPAAPLFSSQIPKHNTDDLPDNFNWGDVDGTSYLTRSLNQHIPQYCGSCWAHGALSALGDRIKITNSSMDEINLSIQYILNCGTRVAGSCHGGSHTGVYDFITQTGYVPYDTCQPYMACSSESKEGFCSKVGKQLVDSMASIRASTF